jgi:murein DD-endopeptidase MepM/ murein hydrolase activator NlpD
MNEQSKEQNTTKEKATGVTFIWPGANGSNKTIHLGKGTVIACALFFLACFSGVIVSGLYWYSSYQERQELANYREEYGVYTERLQKLMDDNEKMQKELSQVAALEAAVRKKLAQDGDGIPNGEIDRESQKLDKAGQGSNKTVDKLDVLEVQDEITVKRLAYKKENLFNMLNELNHEGDGSYIWPLDKGEISSYFGYRVNPFGGGGDFHPGLDIAEDYGTPIKASNSGVVEMADWNGGYGRYVRINHGGGLATAYGHMSAIAVQVGQVVKKGDTIGFVGNSGASTGPHVHFEVLVNGDQVNPLDYAVPKR